MDPVGLIQVPKVAGLPSFPSIGSTAVLLPVLAGSFAVSSRPLRMNSSERTAQKSFFLVFYVVCVSLPQP